ncbi:MAG: SWF/SNF helicase family protein, partial [Spirochaetales bacterium]|nr:SWF/SNF helicase family protein [Spirochaetales bacterium]
KRDDQVERFQTERGPGVFLISLKAGGVGLNLTAATRVVHYDLWFNPAVENQATDRAFRIGQSKNVFVHRLIARDTIEERIDAMITSKRGLSELTVRAGESWLADLSDNELRELVALR